MDNLNAYKIAGIGGGSLTLGVVSGLATWWAQEAVDSQIRDKPWLLPLLVGVAGTGVGIWLFT